VEMRIRSLIVLVAATSFAAAVAAERAPRGELQVKVTGFRSDSGDLAIALFGSESDYQQQSNAVRSAWLSVDGEQVEWTVSGLPAGEYAVIAYHDENGNRELDFRVLGIPREPVGVSNNARGVFGPPRFNAAKFSVRDGEIARQSIRLR
jgi:uncharacterized protein (DUF2141 family)